MKVSSVNPEREGVKGKPFPLLMPMCADDRLLESRNRWSERSGETGEESPS
jgi:hypothetical protein